MFLDYCIQPATIELPTGANKKGVQQFGSPTSTRVFFEGRSRNFQLSDGTQVALVGTVYVPGEVTLATGAKLTTGGTTYKVFDFDIRLNLDGLKFYEVAVEELKGAG